MSPELYDCVISTGDQVSDCAVRRLYPYGLQNYVLPFSDILFPLWSMQRSTMTVAAIEQVNDYARGSDADNQDA